MSIWRAAGILAVATSAACTTTVAGGAGGGGGAGGSSTATGPSDVPATFWCGSEMCHAGQVCETSEDEVYGDSSGCVNIPDACLAQPTCECLGDTVCAGEVNPYDSPMPCCGADGCSIACVMP